MEGLRYEAPETLAAAVALLAAASGTVLAGGTDLIVQMETDLIEPQLLVDIKKIREMRNITAENGGFRVGAAVTGMEIMDHAGLCKNWPGVVDGVKLIGSIQIRGRATVGGNLCNASPAADSVPALVAAGAVARVVGANGVREVPVEQISLGPGKTSLAKGEIVVSLFLPPRPPHAGDAYQRLTPRTEMDIAVVGVGISLPLDDGGVLQVGAGRTRGGGTDRAVGAGGAAALIGTRVDDAALERLAAAASAACRPIDDKRGTKEYGSRWRECWPSVRPDRRSNGRDKLMSKKHHVTTTVNGDEYEFLCEPQQTLLDVLRDELMLSGTKEGCGTGDCGACSVVVDGTLVCSCLVLAVETEGKSIETIEGMAQGDQLHPLQRKFLELTGLQCGICTPGVLIAAKALLERNPDPTETEVRYWLAGNLCRCTGYDKIIRSVLAAAEEMRGGRR